MIGCRRGLVAGGLAARRSATLAIMWAEVLHKVGCTLPWNLSGLEKAKSEGVTRGVPLGPLRTGAYTWYAD